MLFEPEIPGKMRKKHQQIIVWGLFAFLLLWGNEALAQCAMCRTAAEGATAHKASQAQALNDGIIYIMIIPYVLLGSIFFLWWKFRKRNAAAAKS